MKTLNFTNLLFSMIGLVGFIIGVLIFIVIATGIDISDGGDPVRSGSILFVSFIMCSGVAFGGLIIMALTQISSTMMAIRKLLEEREEREMQEKSKK